MAESVDIDLYENIEEGFDQDGEFGQDADLYDDVIITQSSSNDIKESSGLLSPTSDEPKKNNVPSSMPAGYTGRRFSVYVGNLTWWTTDQDLTDALSSIGVNDLLEIKFYENRANGQSKGFAIVIVKSEMSSRAIFDKLSRKELHGQTPMVTHCNKQALNNFEAQARKGEPPPQQNGGNFGRGRGESRPDQPPRAPAPASQPQQQPPPRAQPGVRPPNPFPQPVRGPPPNMAGPPPSQGPPVVTSGPPPNFFPGQRPGMPPVSVPVSMAHGGIMAPRMNQPPPGMPPRPEHRLPPPGMRPGAPPVTSILRPIAAPYPVRGQAPPQPVPPPGIRGVAPGIPGMPPSQPPPGVPPPGHPVAPPAPHVNPAFFPPAHGSALPPPTSHPAPTVDPYGRPPPTSTYPPSDPYRPAPDRYDPKRSEPPAPQLSEQEFEEIFQRNKTVSSSAISRAVQDASAGDFASAIETLVTAISLIKQSKIANDDRCKILISSLQDTLHGIEEKSYGSNPSSMKHTSSAVVSRSRERGRSRSRERDRDREREKRSRHRSRSREREYRERSRERDSRREYEERHRESRSDRRDSDRDREREREYRSSRH
ncbi:cleavage and polyadenylation specificity factor subunit 6-like isoform X2 [Ruditapes philippinarum]|uniref:cleavage and polyadenylation specificity factor subunit 6-like isoform X2 n=1 Tax=Ruditapes philippinarum TaxID=129788 RepID=UPI00295BF902|nr:cleavage and polyadenylation specificity factor subunit 6-like isoform X2 [Ruditapes philippinarum]